MSKLQLNVYDIDGVVTLTNVPDWKFIEGGYYTTSNGSLGFNFTPRSDISMAVTITMHCNITSVVIESDDFAFSTVLYRPYEAPEISLWGAIISSYLIKDTPWSIST